jgi:pyruvate/2-oxoglutarate dehydrogenase complex dihydrolipoamide acyltransferase (E2) component
VAKKSDKTLQDLAKELKKLRKENEKLAKAVGSMREDQVEYHRKVLDLIEERLSASDADADDHSHDENGGFVTAETAEARDGDVPEASAEAQQAQGEGPEVTDAAKRRAKELGVDPTTVEGTGSGSRVLVKDVEAAAGR